MRDGDKAVVATNRLTINNDEGMTWIYYEGLQLDFTVVAPCAVSYEVIFWHCHALFE